MGLLKLAIDRQNKALVSFNGSVTALPPLYQTNSQDFRIQIVDPSGGPFSTTYTAVDCSASELRVVLAVAATAETDSILAATYAAGWSYDAGNNWFTGTLDFNTAEIQQFIGSATHKAAVLEINLVTDSTPETVFGSKSGGTNVILNGNADEDGTTAPSVLTAPPSIGSKAIQDGVGGVTIVDNVVTVTGLGLAFTPSYFLLFINAPSGSGAITGNFVIGSGSSGGFSFVLSAIPENNNYTVTYVPVA